MLINNYLCVSNLIFLKQCLTEREKATEILCWFRTNVTVFSGPVESPLGFCPCTRTGSFQPLLHSWAYFPLLTSGTARLRVTLSVCEHLSSCQPISGSYSTLGSGSQLLFFPGHQTFKASGPTWLWEYAQVHVTPPPNLFTQMQGMNGEGNTIHIKQDVSVVHDKKPTHWSWSKKGDVGCFGFM